jgi:DNA invertase Pin-like site-specific DNA recombinase
VQGESNPAAILYAAKSTEDTHGSIGTQLDDGRAMALREGYEVVAEYHEDSRSAYHGNRGSELLAAKEHAVRLIAEGREVAIFVQHSDRLARGDGITAMHLVEHVLWAMKANVALRSVQDDDACRNLLYAAVNGTRNHEDSKRKAAATAAGVRREVMKGRWHGRAPYGYRRDEERELLKDDAAAEIVRRIFNEYVTGGAGTSLVAHNLNEDGVRPPRGERWGRTTVRNILRSPAYIGKVTINGEVFDGNHPPIVDVAMWQRAQTQREARRLTNSHLGRPPIGSHLLTGGLLRCGECGAAMRPRSLGERGRQDRYECSNRQSTGGYTRCSMKGVLRKDVDGPLLRYLETVVFDIDETRRVIAEEHVRRSSESAALIAQAERDAAKADASLARIRADYESGKLGVDDWMEFRTDLTERRDAATRQAVQLTAHAEEFTAEVEAFDVDTEVAARLAALREAVAGEVTSAEGLAAVRAALRRCFTAITLWQAGQDGLVLVPTVVAWDDLTTFIDLGDGRAVSTPYPGRVVVPGPQVDRDQT